MCGGNRPLNKFEYAATVATSLAYLLLKQHDAVSCIAFDEAIRTTVAPSSNPSHLRDLVGEVDKILAA